jgi:hypothetical protein
MGLGESEREEKVESFYLEMLGSDISIYIGFDPDADGGESFCFVIAKM